MIAGSLAWAALLAAQGHPWGTTISFGNGIEGHRPTVSVGGPEGRLVVTAWHSYTDIRSRRYSLDQGLLPGPSALNSFEDEQDRARISASPDGTFVVVWRHAWEGYPGVMAIARRLGSDGLPVGSELRFPEPEVFYPTVDVAHRPDGAFLVVWESHSVETDVRGQLFDGLGAPLTADVVVNQQVQGRQSGPRTVSISENELVVLWRDGETGTMAGRCFDGSGPVGAEFTLEAGEPGDVASAQQGTALVVWDSASGVYGRVVGCGGPSASAFQIAAVTISGLDDPSVAALADGSYVAVWRGQGSDEVRGRRVCSGGPCGTEFGASGRPVGQARQYPSVAAAPNGDFLVVWQEQPEIGASPRIFGQRFSPPIFRDGFEAGNTSSWGSDR